MNEANACFFCGKELVPDLRLQRCIYCGGEGIETACPDGHFICQSCQAKSIPELIEQFCLKSGSRNPVETAVKLMKSPHFRMHCPEHHFLVPAVLLAAYGHAIDDSGKLRNWLAIARSRAEKVPGAFCGTHGSCGAAIGTGIFLSIITGATPYSEKEWKLCNAQVGRSLLLLAGYDGPRCCKRVTYLSLLESGKFIRENLGVQLDIPEKIICDFSELNKQECLKEKCPFYQDDVLF